MCSSDLHGIGEQRLPGEQKGIAIGQCPGDVVAADGAIGAAAVIDDDDLIDQGLQLFAERTGVGVGRAARWERHDEADRAIGVFLRVDVARDCAGDNGEAADA